MVNLGSTVSNGLRRMRTSVRGDGADRSGLSALTELSFVNAAGDALVTVALAGSLFFSVPSAEARSKVALYLLITMVPFALLAPVIGPLLDRVAYGRRTALAAICLGRGLLAWQLAGALDGLGVYPLALGLLVLSRGFGVARSAVIPRVAPAELTLVKVNSRISLVNIVAGAIVAPLGLGIANVPFVGYPWVLRICALVYMLGVLLAFNLPGHVDSAAGELPLRGPLAVDGGRRGIGSRLRAFVGGLPVALRATVVLRGLVGFLTFYLAFLLRTSGGNNLWLGGLATCAGVGSGLGVFIGGRLGRRRPEGILMLALVMAAGGCLGAAITYTRFTSLLAALLASMAGSMGKLALDAIIQRDIPEATRNSGFARSETGLQLAWVFGGALGLIKMPGTLGFALAAIALGVTLFAQAGALRHSRLAARARARGPGVGAPVSPGPAGTGHPGPAYPPGTYPEGADPVSPAGVFPEGSGSDVVHHAVTGTDRAYRTETYPVQPPPAGVIVQPGTTGAADAGPTAPAPTPATGTGTPGARQPDPGWAATPVTAPPEQDPDRTNPFGYPPFPPPGQPGQPGVQPGQAPVMHTPAATPMPAAEPWRQPTAPIPATLEDPTRPDLPAAPRGPRWRRRH